MGDTITEIVRNFFIDARLDGPGLMSVLAFVVVMFIIWQWHEVDSRLDLRTLLIDKETDRVSLHKFGQFIALVVSTVAFYYEMLHGRLSEWLFVSYMLAWSGVNIASKWIDSKRPHHSTNDTESDTGRKTS